MDSVRLRIPAGATFQRWLTVLLLLAVQLHFCSANYELPNGQACVECPTLSDDHSVPADGRVSSTDHGDCHDCCELKACDDSGAQKSVVTGTISLVLAIDLPPSAPQVSGGVSEPKSAIPVYFAGCPPTGPPSQ